jgi:hypothetical protein
LSICGGHVSKELKCKLFHCCINKMENDKRRKVLIM